MGSLGFPHGQHCFGQQWLRDQPGFLAPVAALWEVGVIYQAARGALGSAFVVTVEG